MQKTRLERYVITNSRTGLFKVGTVAEIRSHRRGKEVKVPLKVCKNCLKVLYPGLSQSQRNSLCEQFNLAEFLDTMDEERFSRLPSRHEDDDYNYPDDWDAISQRARESKGWKCSRCGVDLSEHRNLLHTHHINGVKSDTSCKNLESLCVLCHQKEHRNNMHVSLEHRRAIERFRREQGVGESVR